MAGQWRKSRTMNLVNRGLTTVIKQEWLSTTESYRVTRIERMLGAAPSTTHDRILDDPEASESFRALCIEAVDLDFKFPEKVSDINVVDLTEADSE